jgi:hypothetical protein
LVGVDVNDNYFPPLHADNGDEKKGLIKNKIVEAIVRKSVEKATLILLTHVA